jgi:hypothetical protein
MATVSAHDAVAAVEDALNAVLLSAQVRGALQAGDNLGLSEQLANDLRTPSRCDVDALAAEISARLSVRANRGVGRLKTAFPKTFAAWNGVNGSDETPLFEAFLASTQAAPWKPVPFAGLGPCLEECFATWAVEQAWADAGVVQHEMLSAVCRALATDPDPAFVPPTAFTGEPGHWIAVTVDPSPTVYAAVRGRVVTGAVTPLIAGVLRGEADAALAERLGVTVQSVGKTREAVAKKGLLRG